MSREQEVLDGILEKAASLINQQIILLPVHQNRIAKAV